MQSTPLTEDLFVQRLGKKGKLRFAKDGNALVKTLKKLNASAVREHVSGFVTPTIHPPLQKAVLAVCARKKLTISLVPSHLILPGGGRASYILIVIH